MVSATSTAKRQPSSRRSTNNAAYGVHSYSPGHDKIKGTTTMDVTATAAGLRVLPIDPDPRLRIEEAMFGDAKGSNWTPVGVIQGAEKEDGNAAVVFPAP